MRPGEVGVPYRVADGLATRERRGAVGLDPGSYRGKTRYRDEPMYLDIARADLSASNMAERAFPRLWRWRPDPPPCAGSKSFPPRLGMTGRAAWLPLPRLNNEGRLYMTNNKVGAEGGTYGSFVQSSPPSSPSEASCSWSSLLSPEILRFGECFGCSNVSSMSRSRDACFVYSRSEVWWRGSDCQLSCNLSL